MGKLKVIIYLTLFLIANNAFSQIDTIDFRFVNDVATYRIRCQAQKVDTVLGEPVFTDFEISDTLNGKYRLDWGGDIEPQIDGLPFVTYEFIAPATYSFTLSVYEDATGTTFTRTKTFTIVDNIIIPNVFTPNADGVNDLFVVRANGINVLEISIFSRSGSMVYSSKSPIIVWDGRNSSGSEMSEGIYYYILKSDDPAVPDKTGFIQMYR